MQIITYILNINKLRTTRAKSVKLHTIRKLVEYCLENVRQRECFFLSILEILLSKCRLVLWPTQRITGSERVKVVEIVKKVIGLQA